MAEKNTPEELEVALTEAMASIEALTRKNSELIAEKRSTKTGAEAKLSDLEAQVSDLQETAKKVDSAHKAVLDKITKERDELAKNLGETSTKAREYETRVTLREALGKIGVGKLNAEDVTDAMGFVQSMLTCDEHGSAFVAYKGSDGKDVKQALGEYVEKVYPTTTHAKRFIPADGNRGAGAGLSKPGAKPGAKAGGNPWVKDSFNLTRQTELIRTNKAEAVRMAAEAGVAIE